MATIFRAMLHAVQTLVLLFAGKKHNPFRERIDSYASSRVHILIGTLFFTIIIFLLPTVLISHLYFSLVGVLHVSGLAITPP
jgi:phosphatidylinositol glycan class Q protein